MLAAFKSNIMENKQTNFMTNGDFAIYHDLFIKVSMLTVFEAITEPNQLNNWWTFKCSGKPEVGAEYNFYFAPGYDWKGKVIKCEAEQAFHIKMIKSDPDWDSTSFGFDLQEVNNGVQLKFWHIGWPECNHPFRRSSYCWAMLLNGLKNYVEKGVIVPFEERE